MDLIPQADLAEFHHLPHAVQRRVRAVLAEVEGIRPPLDLAWTMAGQRLGKSRQTMRRIYYQVRAMGWRGALDGRVVARQAEGLPWAFVQEFRRRVETYQRNGGRSAYAALCADWTSGQVIPGYEAVAPTDRRFFPEGWSYGNLMKAAQKAGTKAQMVAARIGKAAAAPYLPKVFSTRVGLYVGSHFMFDDMWHDNFVHWRGKAVRVLEFDGLDVFSGAKMDWLMKPRFERADGTQDGLKEAQMRSLLAKILGEIGYSPRGTELMAEHGTAAIREAIERLLHDRSGGLIRVRRSGMIGKEQAVAGWFHGFGGGNPRFKAPLESARNLYHNRFAALAAQTGLSPEVRPESTAGLLKYHDALMGAMAVLPAGILELLRLPLLTFEQFAQVALALYDAINRRGERPEYGTHELEGWAQCGHIVTEYRLSGASDVWLPQGEFLALTAGEQAAITALVRADAERYARVRALSPREVFTAGRRDLVTLPEPVLAEIITGGVIEEGPLARVLPVCGAYFEFKDQLLGPGDHRYSAEITELNGRIRELPHGEKYLAVIDPAGHRLFIHDAKGRFLGVAGRDTRVQRGDDEALRHRFGEVTRRTGNALRPLSQRHAASGEATVADMRHNAGVIEAARNPNAAEDARAERTAAKAAKAGAAMAGAGDGNDGTHGTYGADEETFDARGTGETVGTDAPEVFDAR
jgi:hypothetical protein